ncbi:MAG TPA: hypothetical protein VFU47_12825, partial [Armatimonadota bacterium]|nr:hypothetical protein [Armatimonadota bacterium]
QAGVPVLVDSTRWPERTAERDRNRKGSLEVRGSFNNVVYSLSSIYDCGYRVVHGRVYLWPLPDLQRFFARLAALTRAREAAARQFQPSTRTYQDLLRLRQQLNGKSVRIGDLPAGLRGQVLNLVYADAFRNNGPLSRGEARDLLRQGTVKLVEDPAEGTRSLDFHFEDRQPQGVREVESTYLLDTPRRDAERAAKARAAAKGGMPGAQRILPPPPLPPAGSVIDEPPKDDPLLSRDPRLQPELELAACRERPLSEVLQTIGKAAGVPLVLSREVEGKEYLLTYPALKAPAHILLHVLAFHYGLAWHPRSGGQKGYSAEAASPEDPLADDLRRLGDELEINFRLTNGPVEAVEAIKGDRDLWNRLQKGQELPFGQLTPAQQTLLDSFLDYSQGRILWGRMTTAGKPLDAVVSFPMLENGPLTIGYRLGGNAGLFTLPAPPGAPPR